MLIEHVSFNQFFAHATDSKEPQSASSSSSSSSSAPPSPSS